MGLVTLYITTVYAQMKSINTGTPPEESNALCNESLQSVDRR